MGKILIFLLSLQIFINGCTVYHPQMIDVPLIDHKGESRIDLGASVFPSVYSTFSYGLTNKIALQTFCSVGSEERYYFQVSPGLYKCLSDKKVIEFYGGIGFGHANTLRYSAVNYLMGTDYYKESLYGNYQLYFIQFNWGKNTKESRVLDWGLGLKMGLFHSALTDHNYYAFYSETGPFPTNRENSILIEPIFSFRIGKEKAKFTFKFGMTQILNHSSNPIPAPIINLGLGVNFKPKLFKSDKKN